MQPHHSWDLSPAFSSAESGPPRLGAGARLGPFRIEGAIGEGGQGTVFVALDEESGRRVAIKRVDSRDARQVARLRREAQALALVSHPNVLVVHDFGLTSDGETAWLVTEYVEATSIAQAILGKSDAAKLDLFRQAVAGVAAAHQQRLLHRDLKPENLLVDPHGRVRVADFGLAHSKVFAERLTQTGAFVGTPFYMAPEQWLGKEAPLGPTLDVWSLGVVLYELFADRLPFPGPTLSQLMAQIVAGPPDLNDLPASLRSVAARCLRQAPEERYASATALLQALPPASSLTGRACSARAWKGRLGLLVAACAALGAGAWAAHRLRRSSSERVARITSSPSQPATAPADVETRRLAEADALLDQGQREAALDLYDTLGSPPMQKVASALVAELERAIARSNVELATALCERPSGGLLLSSGEAAVARARLAEVAILKAPLLTSDTVLDPEPVRRGLPWLRLALLLKPGGSPLSARALEHVRAQCHGAIFAVRAADAEVRRQRLAVLKVCASLASDDVELLVRVSDGLKHVFQDEAPAFLPLLQRARELSPDDTPRIDVLLGCILVEQDAADAKGWELALRAYDSGRLGQDDRRLYTWRLLPAARAAQRHLLEARLGLDLTQDLLEGSRKSLSPRAALRDVMSALRRHAGAAPSEPLRAWLRSARQLAERLGALSPQEAVAEVQQLKRGLKVLEPGDEDR